MEIVLRLRFEAELLEPFNQLRLRFAVKAAVCLVAFGFKFRKAMSQQTVDK